MITICITIILVALIAAGCILGCKYFQDISGKEAAMDTQLDDISIIIGKAKSRHENYMFGDEQDKYKSKHTDNELLDIFDTVYRISTRGFEQDDKK